MFCNLYVYMFPFIYISLSPLYRFRSLYSSPTHMYTYIDRCTIRCAEHQVRTEGLEHPAHYLQDVNINKIVPSGLRLHRL